MLKEQSDCKVRGFWSREGRLLPSLLLSAQGGTFCLSAQGSASLSFGPRELRGQEGEFPRWFAKGVKAERCKACIPQRVEGYWSRQRGREVTVGKDLHFATTETATTVQREGVRLPTDLSAGKNIPRCSEALGGSETKSIKRRMSC